MKEWYWTKASRDADFGIYRALYRLGFIKWCPSIHTAPALSELALDTARYTKFKDINIIVGRANIAYKKGHAITRFSNMLDITYYDGYHIRLYLKPFPIIITWSC